MPALAQLVGANHNHISSAARGIAKQLSGPKLSAVITCCQLNEKQWRYLVRSKWRLDAIRRVHKQNGWRYPHGAHGKTQNGARHGQTI